MFPTVSVSVTAEQLEEIKQCYGAYIIPNSGEYVVFNAQKEDLTVTAYQNKKGAVKVVFKGPESLKNARKWDINANVKPIKKQIKENWECLKSQIGSDEVGVGDFLLPLIVVASYVKESDVKELIKLGIHDSKKLSDAQILLLGPRLVKKFPYSKLTLTNQKYNLLIAKGENLNSLKAKMHNRCLSNLKSKFPDVPNVFIDQFVSINTYYRYLEKGNDVPLTGITFKCKGESFYPSVALASVIARYALIKEKERLEEKYKTAIPFGAGKKADDTAQKLLNHFGLKEIDKLVKKNFYNYQTLTASKLL